MCLAMPLFPVCASVRSISDVVGRNETWQAQSTDRLCRLPADRIGESIKAQTHTKVKHPFRVIKQQFWHVKTR